MHKTLFKIKLVLMPNSLDCASALYRCIRVEKTWPQAASIWLGSEDHQNQATPGQGACRTTTKHLWFVVHHPRPECKLESKRQRRCLICSVLADIQQVLVE